MANAGNNASRLDETTVFGTDILNLLGLCRANWPWFLATRVSRTAAAAVDSSAPEFLITKGRRSP